MPPASIHVNMKRFLLPLSTLCLASAVHAQFYYKDIIVPLQAAAQLATYRVHQVHRVTLASFEADGSPTENFAGSQHIDPDFTTITTDLQTAIAGASELVSTFNAAGQLLSSADTADGSSSITRYAYSGGQATPSRIVNLASSAGGHQDREEHLWTFAGDKPTAMIRIKGSSDSTFIRFVTDEKGNVAEEHATRNGAELPAYYYYYDDRNRLTDVVTYNVKAKRLLPAYVFEYNDDGTLRKMIVVPEGSSDYQQWVYEYADGLKTRETVFNKKKQLIGKIEYRYQ